MTHDLQKKAEVEAKKTDIRVRQREMKKIQEILNYTYNKKY